MEHQNMYEAGNTRQNAAEEVSYITLLGLSQTI
jgi:hypothetical protein